MLTLIVAAALLVGAERQQWFFGDEWDFINLRALRGGSLGLFIPHNEHWSTLPILEYRALYRLFGLRSYWPYISVVVALHLVLTHLLWRTMHRLGVTPATACGLTGVFSVFGAGAENLLWAFQAGFIGSVVFGYGAVLALLEENPSRRRLLVAQGLLVLALMCSGVGITMTFFAGVALAFRRQWRTALAVVGASGFVFAVWYIAFGRGSFGAGTAVKPSLSTVSTALPGYLGIGVGGVFSGLIGIPGAGLTLALLIIGLIMRRPAWWAGLRSTAMAGALAMLCFFALTGIGRLSLGQDQASASRYAYIGAALALPLVALCVDDVTARLRRPAIAVAAAATLLALNGTAQLYGMAGAESGRRQASKSVVLAAAQLAQEGAPILAERPDPVYAPQLMLRDLRRMIRDHTLPALDPGPVGVVTAEARLQTIVTAGSDQPVGTQIAGYATSTPVLREENCATVVAAGGVPQVVVLFAGPGATLQLTSQSGGAGQLFIVRGGALSQAADFSLGLKVRSVLRTVAPSGEMILTLPAVGATQICSAAPPP